jgi:hypothetical protein
MTLDWANSQVVPPPSRRGVTAGTLGARFTAGRPHRPQPASARLIEVTIGGQGGRPAAGPWYRASALSETSPACDRVLGISYAALIFARSWNNPIGEVSAAMTRREGQQHSSSQLKGHLPRRYARKARYYVDQG